MLNDAPNELAPQPSYPMTDNFGRQYNITLININYR